ncbi:MAG TPA: nitroreductase, partial [Steroidobacteraceae bacterium]|nr:nitroreductase [Steroidobacteraceae bacterium]
QSARALTEPAPDAAALDLIFESAARAPDHGRLRPWRFVVIGTEARARFGELLAEHLRRTRGSASDEALERERRKAFRAPVIVVVAAAVTVGGKIPEIEQVLSAGAAAHTVLLAAAALGFSGVWKTGGAAYDDTVKRALGLQSRDSIVGFIYLGTEETAAAAAPPRPGWRDLVRHWR